MLGKDALSPEHINLETSIKLTNLLPSATYRARYRAINLIGVGEWSDIAYLLVASKPNAPRKPILSSVDNTQITVTIPQSTDDNGAPIVRYSLYLNEGVDGSEFHEITAYDGFSS